MGSEMCIRDRIIHNEKFQELESAWRGLSYLVNNTQTSESMKIRVLNVSKKDLAKSLKKFKGTAWDQSPLFKKLYEDEYGTAGGEPFGCLIGDYYFNHTAPDLELLKEYQKAADGNIRYITVSPEVKGVPEAIKGMTDLGMKVAIGHSGADYDTSWKCINEGAVAATHTFNAMKLLHQHFPAIMGAVLESDIYCEAICDGRHLHPGTVRFLLKMKGLDKVIAITDSIMAAGLPDGEYMLGVNPVIVKDGDAKLKYGDSRAGSTLTTGCALKNLIKFTGRSLEEILPLLTCNPAKMLDVYDRIGSLDTGKDADVVILDEEYSVIDTFVKGRKIEQ